MYFQRENDVFRIIVHLNYCFRCERLSMRLGQSDVVRCNKTKVYVFWFSPMLLIAQNAAFKGRGSVAG